MQTSTIIRRVKEEEEEAGEKQENLSNECKELLLSLPKEIGWRTPHLFLFQGFWCQPKEIQSIMCFQKNFESKGNDIVIATIPKSGTTWLKALVFAIMHREKYSIHSNKHPLLTFNPHDLVPFFEYKLYANINNNDQLLPHDHLSNLPHSTRVFATHIPFASLKESINHNNTRVVYLYRNPLDTFISSWHYVKKLRSESQGPFLLEECFEMYYKGVIAFGPFWDHMLGYWRESLERPDKVLFFKYEDMKADIISHLKRLAIFLGFPFLMEDERQGVIEEIANLCSFENLKKLEVNKSGKSIKYFENKYLFRKAEVDDWANYFSPSMLENLSQVMEEKLGGSGLTFKLFS